MKRICLILLLLAASSLSARSQINENKYFETWLQYVPAAAELGLGFLGVKTEYDFVDRFLASGVAWASEAILVNGTKALVKEERPDGSAYNSFPSGHTATAFMGAELVRKDYGWGWGLGAYAVATTVGVARVQHQRHWPWDVMGGAIVGILSANIGCWVRPHARKGWEAIFGPRVQVSAVPMIDFSTGCYAGSLAISF